MLPKFTMLEPMTTLFAGGVAAAGAELSGLSSMSSALVIFVSVLSTTFGTIIVQKFTNQSHDSKLAQETQTIILHNLKDLLSLKEKEVQDYKSKIDLLIDKVEGMERTISALKRENAKLTMLLSQDKIAALIKSGEYDYYLGSDAGGEKSR